jgi:xanthine dehydrogenase accessory factor
MDRRETERIVAAIHQARDTGARVALATVVRVKGNAYRREGARIVVREDGSFECLLSGGCLEPAVADAALRVIATGEPVLLEYNLAEDSVFGLGIGCSGAVDVRIERVDDDRVMNAWVQVLERGERAVLVTPLANASGRLIVSASGDTIGGLDDARTERAAVAEAVERLRAIAPRSAPLQVGIAELFFEFSEPAPVLVIFGGGPDAPPLATHAHDLGFNVTVVDPRATMLTADRFPGCTLRPLHHTDFANAVPLTLRSYVVIMNHHLERDAESLRYALASRAPYIGVLGPRDRYERLLAQLEAGGTAPRYEDLSRVRSPIGLALGAESPEEIAVSILGEIVAFRRGFDGGVLSGRKASLHSAGDNSVFARS